MTTIPPELIAEYRRQVTTEFTEELLLAADEGLVTAEDLAWLKEYAEECRREEG